MRGFRPAGSPTPTLCGGVTGAKDGATAVTFKSEAGPTKGPAPSQAGGSPVFCTPAELRDLQRSEAAAAGAAEGRATPRSGEASRGFEHGSVSSRLSPWSAQAVGPAHRPAEEGTLRRLRQPKGLGQGRPRPLRSGATSRPRLRETRFGRLGQNQVSVSN